MEDERTLGQAVMDCRYGVAFNDLNERLYRRLDTFLTIVGLVAGASAVIGIAKNSADWSTFAGACAAVLAIVQASTKPGELAARHNEFKRKFAALDAQAWKLGLEGVDAQLKSLQAEAPPGLRSLALPAYNANLASNGFEKNRETLSALSWLLCRIV